MSWAAVLHPVQCPGDGIRVRGSPEWLSVGFYMALGSHKSSWKQ